MCVRVYVRCFFFHKIKVNANLCKCLTNFIIWITNYENREQNKQFFKGKEFTLFVLYCIVQVCKALKKFK